MACLLQFPVSGRLVLLKLEQQQRKIQVVLAMSHRSTRIGFILMRYGRTNGGTQLGSSRQDLLGAVMGWELGGSFSFLPCGLEVPGCAKADVPFQVSAAEMLLPVTGMRER